MNSTVLPFAAMIVLSIALIAFVFRSRKRVMNSASKRDNRFAVAAVTLNVLFLVLNLPMVIDDLVHDMIDDMGANPNDLLDMTSTFLYYLSYAIGFYAQFVVNRDFRRELFKLLGIVSDVESGLFSGQVTSLKTAAIKTKVSFNNLNQFA